jgi:hypothetical protein
MSEAAANAVFAILILLVVAALVIRGLAWNQVKGLLARGWPTCQGTVEFGSVEERHTRYKNLYVGRIDYSYSVNGEYYSGWHERLFVWEGSANRFVEAMKKQMVFIRYKPERPERSVLLKQDQPAGWPA